MDAQKDVLFDPHNSDHLAILIGEYLSDARLRKHIAAWGRDYTRQFDVGVVGPQLVDIYKKALRKRSGQ
jgi:hypothetical protein